MTGWGVGSSNHTVSTIQSYETANPGADSLWADSVGIFAGIVPLFRSPVTLAVSQADFWPPVSASKNSVPRGKVLTANAGRLPGVLGVLGGQKRVVWSPAGRYRGFNPRASNCRLHSAGASRNRSTPMPRGKRPSTAARTRSGARNAREIVMLTWRTLHF
jgi:hypothetical protein